MNPFAALEGYFVHWLDGALHIHQAQLKINHKETAAGDAVAAVVDDVLDPMAAATVQAAISNAVPTSVQTTINQVGEAIAAGADTTAPIAAPAPVGATPTGQ